MVESFIKYFTNIVYETIKQYQMHPCFSPTCEGKNFVIRLIKRYHLFFSHMFQKRNKACTNSIT